MVMKKSNPCGGEESMQKVMETIKGARPEELFLVALKLAEVELRHRSGNSLSNEAYEQCAMKIIARHINLIRNLNIDSKIRKQKLELALLSEIDISKMTIN